jgi:hypothetical protein
MMRGTASGAALCSSTCTAAGGWYSTCGVGSRVMGGVWQLGWQLGWQQLQGRAGQGRAPTTPARTCTVKKPEGVSMGAYVNCCSGRAGPAPPLTALATR